MRLVELSSDPQLVERLARQQSPERSTGLHVSSVLRWIDNHAIHKGQRKAFEDLSPAERVRMGGYTTGGWVWEDIVRESLVKVLHRDLYYVGEVSTNGIVGTPDGLYINDGEWIQESKATWRSSRRPLETDFRSWLWQIKSYCYMMDVPRAKLDAMFINGDYRDSGPQIKQWEMEFTKRELEENWTMVLNNRTAMRRESHSG